MPDETQDHPAPDEEADLEDTLAQIDKVRKQLRENAVPISEAEVAARNDRIRIERAAEIFDRARIDLVTLRKSKGANLGPWLSQIRGMASSASVSGDLAGIAYHRLQPIFTEVRTLTSGVVASAGTANYLSTEAYYEARKRDESLDPHPPSTRCPPLVYLEEAATRDQKDLESMLSGLAPSLCEKLSGARAALASRQPDHVAQAHESMQELLDQLLHHFGDDIIKGKTLKDERVKKAPWWKPDHQHGVTRAHRVRFIVQGYAPQVDAETERHIEELVKQVRTLGEIQAEKHRHGPSSEEQVARGRLGALEAFLLYLLRSHRPDLHQTPANSHR